MRPGPPRRDAGHTPRRSCAAWPRTAFAAAVVALALAGCRNPFAPSEPQPPVEAAVPVRTDYATPEGVLTTIRDAVFARNQSDGAAAYIGAFSDTGYVQVFDPGVVEDRIRASKAIPNWNRAYERTFYPYLFRQQVLLVQNPALYTDADYVLSWTPEIASDDINLDSGVATLYRLYHLTATISDGSVAQLAYGHARIVMERNASGTRWAITRWEDTTDPAYGPAPQGDNAGFRSFSRLRIDSTEQ